MNKSDSLTFNAGDSVTLEKQNASSSITWQFWFIVGGVAILWMLPILWLHYVNGRLLASWHGFLHTAIANQMMRGDFPPENPFYAGEVLPYYWVYHYIGHTVSTALHIDQLHVFQGISLLSVFVLVVCTAIIGKRLCQSTGAGLLIGYLALVGVNPLGPAIATAKHYMKDVSLFTNRSSYVEVENIFVSWHMADTLMTQSLLPAMYITSNWKHGQNLVWFFDISSRTPALALLVVCVLLFVLPRLHVGRESLLLVMSCLTTSLSPLIGFGMAGSLFGGAVLVLLWARIVSYMNQSIPLVDYSYLMRAGICLLGCMLAYPAYYHLFEIHQSTVAFSSFEHVILKTVMIGANFIILIPLALLGALPGKSPCAGGVWSVTVAGILLIGAVPIFSIKPGNEHNLTNIAQCFLAVSAVWGIVSGVERVNVLRSWYSRLHARTRLMGTDGNDPRIPEPLTQRGIAHHTDYAKPVHGSYSSMFMVAVVAICIPTTVGSLLSYTGRPPIPLAVQERSLIRLQPGGALNSLYSWIRENTPYNAIFISDPENPVKMSGNVAELPAFTGRTLFVDSPTYMTQAYSDRQWRENVAHLITHGQGIETQDFTMLRELQRPIFVVTYQAEELGLLHSLINYYGSPVFQKDFVAVFSLT